MPNHGVGPLRTELGRLDHTERRVSWSRHGELEEVRQNQAGPRCSGQFAGGDVWMRGSVTEARVSVAD